MQFEQFIQTATFALSEGSLYERLRRNPAVEFDPYLFHATLIYNTGYGLFLEQVHREYLDVGQRYHLPMFALTDTWRANQERIRQSKFHEHKVNQDNARFIARLRDSYGPTASPIFIGGQIGPRGDAYTPEEALPSAEAERFHTPQLEALAEAHEISYMQQHCLHYRKRKASRQLWQNKVCPIFSVLSSGRMALC